MKKMMLALLICSMARASAFAQEQASAPAQNAQAQNASVQDAKMAEWMKLASPNENHQYLEPFVGSWTHTVRWWMDPSQPAQESKGTSENHWIMGGRFLSQEAKGESMGQPFEGMGITGYDNVRGEYTSIWIDNMGTGMMNATAQYDSATKTFSEKGSMACPMTGEKDKHFRSEWKIVDNDHYTYEMYTNGPDGKEFKNMEISYTRA